MSKLRPKRAVRRWDKTFPKSGVVLPVDSPSAAPPSLPPVVAGQTLAPISALAVDERPRCVKCNTIFLRKRARCSVCGEWHPDKLALHHTVRKEDDSPIRVTALKIWAMRQAGLSDEEISKGIGIAKSTLYSYVYKAGKNGWLEFDDPRDQLEYQLMDKVVRNLSEALDDTSEIPKVKTTVAMKIAEGALFPKLAQAQGPVQPTVMGIKIQIVGNDAGTMREGTIMGGGHVIDVDPE